MLDALHNTLHYQASIGRCDRVSPTNPEFYADCRMEIWVTTALALSYTCRKSRNLIQVNIKQPNRFVRRSCARDTTSRGCPVLACLRPLATMVVNYQDHYHLKASPKTLVETLSSP